MFPPFWGVRLKYESHLDVKKARCYRNKANPRFRGGTATSVSPPERWFSPCGYVTQTSQQPIIRDATNNINTTSTHTNGSMNSSAAKGVEWSLTRSSSLFRSPSENSNTRPLSPSEAISAHISNAKQPDKNKKRRNAGQWSKVESASKVRYPDNHNFIPLPRATTINGARTRASNQSPPSLTGPAKHVQGTILIGW